MEEKNKKKCFVNQPKIKISKTWEIFKKIFKFWLK